jgi:hypothetical protein
MKTKYTLASDGHMARFGLHVCKLKRFSDHAIKQAGHSKYMGNMKLDCSPFLSSCCCVPNVLIALVGFLREGAYNNVKFSLVIGRGRGKKGKGTPRVEWN